MGKEVRAIFFDLSGVLYVGDEPVPGAVKALQQVQASDLALRFVTNTSRKTRAQLLSDLAALGFDIESATLFTAPLAAKAWIRERNLRPFCLVHREIVPEFADLDQNDPNAVILGDAAEDLNYERMNRAFRLCLEGAPLIGIGDNRFFKSGELLYLDAGPFIHAIEYATGAHAIIMGKPSVEFFQQVIATTDFAPGQVLMIGDDVYGDIEGALAAGMQGCLVRTGKYRKGDEGKITGEFSCVGSVTEALEGTF